MLNIAAILHPGLVSELSATFNWRLPREHPRVAMNFIEDEYLYKFRPFSEGETCIVHYNAEQAMKSPAFR